MSTVPASSASLIEALESLNTAAPPTFQALLATLWELRFQGNLTLHFAGGLPRSVTINHPVQVALSTKGT